MNITVYQAMSEELQSKEAGIMDMGRKLISGAKQGITNLRQGGAMTRALKAGAEHEQGMNTAAQGFMGAMGKAPPLSSQQIIANKGVQIPKMRIPGMPVPTVEPGPAVSAARIRHAQNMAHARDTQANAFMGEMGKANTNPALAAHVANQPGSVPVGAPMRMPVAPRNFNPLAPASAAHEPNNPGLSPARVIRRQPAFLHRPDTVDFG